MFGRGRSYWVSGMWEGIEFTVRWSRREGRMNRIEINYVLEVKSQNHAMPKPRTFHPSLS
jgi:hypothetical protein